MININDVLKNSPSGFIEKIGVSSVLNPLLWFAIPLYFFFIIAACALPAYAGYFVFLMCIYPVFVCAMYLLFAIKDPPKLQSESYQLKLQQLMMASMDGPIIDNELPSLNPADLPTNTPAPATMPPTAPLPTPAPVSTAIQGVEIAQATPHNANGGDE
jgi:hypothetical protein